MKLKDKVAVITGASSGIGEGITKRFLEEGAIVTGCGIEESAGIIHSNFSYIRCDITDPDSCGHTAKETVNKHGKIDILVNCAGVTAEGNLENTTAGDFEFQFRVNTLGTFNMCKACIPYLRETGKGAIVNVSSELGVKAIKDRVAYNPSKAAVIMLTKCIAVDYAPEVRANCILPGLVETPMIAERFEKAENPDELRNLYKSFYMLDRLGTTEDMSNAAVFLSCDDSSFITGDEIAVCGGGQLI